MSKSGQPATKADTGGQRVPKSADSTGADKKPTKAGPPPKKVGGKKPGP